jgi:hypothetical protein
VLSVDGGVGFVDGPGGGERPLVYDRFTQDASGVPLLDRSVYPRPSRLLGEALTSSTAFAGRAVSQASGAPVPLFAPAEWREGGSYDHLDEGAFEAGTPDALMTPFLARGERLTAPGAATCALLADIGWDLAGGCAEAVGALPPPGPTAISLLGPNPARVQTALSVQAGAPVLLRVWLADVLGRRVRDVANVVVREGESVVPVPVGGLASGVYLVVTEADGVLGGLPVTVLR